MSELRSSTRTTDELWERLAHLSREVLVVADAEGVVTFVDPTVAATLGYEPEEYVEKAASIVHPDDRDLALAVWLDVVERAGSESHAEYRMRAKDGTWRWMEVTCANLSDDDVVAGIATYFHDVTDRHRAEDAVRRSEERFRALVQHSYDAVVVTDPWIVASYVSPAMEEMFGYLPDELIGVSGLENIHPDDLDSVLSLTDELFAGPGASVVCQFRMRHKAGHWCWVECRSVNLLHHPNVRGIVNNFRDITDAHAAMVQLATNEERLAVLLANSDSAVVVSDETGRLTWVSQPVERLFGDDPQSMVGTRLLKRIHPDDRADVVRRFTKVLEAPDLWARAEARVRHADGNYRWFEAVWSNCIDHPAVRGVVANLRDVTERVLAEQALRESEVRLEHQVTHDHLTGLPNRAWLVPHIEEARERASWSRSLLTLMFFDLDHFKWVNDSRGHEVGDELLVAVARRLQESTRDGDQVARFGGDEFVVFCEGLRDEREAVAEARRIQAAVGGQYMLRGSEVFVRVSAGVATGDPERSLVEELVRDADSAMYEAKGRGRDRLEVFDTRMRSRAVKRLEIESWLRRAVDKDELRVHYQPLVNLESGRITGAEALVRWQHPRQGLLLPGAFIEVAEQSGLIGAMDQWVLASATQMAAGWPSRYGGTDGIAVCVNLSARQFTEPGLTAQVAEYLRNSALPAERLHMEITESVVMDDVEGSIAVLASLRDLGIKVAIDDFGTGYSSLSYLRRLPVDVLKVDRSFVRGLGRDDHDSAIVETIVQLGHRLGLSIVAEGVEDEMQLDHLRRLGCETAQGFLMSRPVPHADFHVLLTSDPRW